MKQLLKKLTLCIVTLALVCGLTPAAFAADASYYDVYLETEGGVCSEFVVFAYKLGGGYYHLGELPTPEMDGYLFEGWYDDQVGGNKITPLYNFTGNTTIYAHWRADSSAKQTAQTTTKADPELETAATEYTTKDKVIAWTVVGVAVGISTLVLVLTAK